MAAACFQPEFTCPTPVAASSEALVRNAGSASARAKALALSKRSAGSFSSAFATAAATFGGTDFRSTVTACSGLM